MYCLLFFKVIDVQTSKVQTCCSHS